MNNPIVFSGNSNPLLTKAVCDDLGVDQGKALVGIFSDGEQRIEILENVRRREVFIVQSTCSPQAENLMEVLLIIDALKRASASRITAVIPYFGYARQDRIRRGQRVPISASMAARMFKVAGAHSIIVTELHSGQIQDAFGLPVDHLYSSPVLVRHIGEKIEKENVEDIIFISPDAGGLPRARHYAKGFGALVGFVDKRRENPNEAEVMNVMADVDGKVCVIVDDMADTYGTMEKASAALLKHGAIRVFAYCTHPVLSGKALNRLERSNMKLVVTDSIPLSDKAVASGKIEVVSIAGLLSEAIKKTCDGGSILSMFE